jgi:predicted MFS family arabinose efflux permease
MALGGTGNNLLLVLGTIGAFTGGWAWTGIFFLSLVKTNPDRPGAVAGIGTAGLGVGNASGPLLFGVVAQSFGYGMAWLGAAMIAAVAAVLMSLARSRF